MRSTGTAPCAPLGNADYPIYAEARFQGAAHFPFYDIVSGCATNDITSQYQLKAYCATTGYDLVTGWGSANMLQLAWAINRNLTSGQRAYLTLRSRVLPQQVVQHQPDRPVERERLCRQSDFDQLRHRHRRIFPSLGRPGHRFSQRASRRHQRSLLHWTAIP